MTDAQYTAKIWLLRLNDYADKLKAERRTLEMMQDRLCRSVSKYEGYTGRADPILARAAHDDALIELSLQAERVEKAQRVYIAELEITKQVIDAIPADLQPLAIDKYINGVKMDKLEKLYNYGKTQLYTFCGRILDNVAEVLNAKKTELIITTTTTGGAHIITAPSIK